LTFFAEDTSGILVAEEILRRRFGTGSVLCALG
jgi:hypothetical protein